MRKEPKEKSSLALSESWPTCELCKMGGVETRIRPDKRAIRHHFHYNPDVTATLCFACHQWLHGQGMTNNHPFKRQFKDEESRKSFAPIIFAYALLALFESKMIGQKQIYLILPTPVSKGSSMEN